MSHFTGISKITICDVCGVNAECCRIIHQGAICFCFFVLNIFQWRPDVIQQQTLNHFGLCSLAMRLRRGRAMTQKRKLSLAFSNF